MKKVKSKKNSKNINKKTKVSVEDLAVMINKNFPTKQDLKDELQKTEERLEEKISTVGVDLKTEIDSVKDELKKYATREELHSVKNELIDVVNLSTNKILSAMVKMQESNEKRFERIEEKVF